MKNLLIFILQLEKYYLTVKNSENAISSNFDLENDENFIKIKNRLEFFINTIMN